MKILVIDDHPLIREAVRQVLRALDQGLELLEAQTSAEALEVVRANDSISLILLDLALPGADGFEALHQLREEFPGIPVVVLSASEQAETVIRSIDGGAMGFIPKTSTSQVLVQALRLVLSGGIYLPPEVLRRHDGGLPRSGDQTAALPPRNPRELGLTDRQLQVLALLIQGKPNKLICRELEIAEGTVKIHVTAILKALGVSNRTQVVIAVSKLGLKFPAAYSRRVRTFMFTDIVASTKLLDVLGDEAWHRLRRWHDRMLRECFESFGGTEIDHAGDGFFVAFESADQALDCAVAIQRRLAGHSDEHGFAPQVRIGVHAAEASQFGTEYAGMGVHEAARIAAVGAGDEIVASRSTLAAAAGRIPYRDERDIQLQGLAAPMAVATVQWK